MRVANGDRNGRFLFDSFSLCPSPGPLLRASTLRPRSVSFHPLCRSASVLPRSTQIFQRFGTVKYVDFSMGNKSYFIRFEEPEAAQKARAAAMLLDYGLFVEVAIRVLCRLGVCAEIRVLIDLFSSYTAIMEEGDYFNDIMNWFNRIKGFGLITPNDGGEDLLVHQSIRSGGYRSLAEGESVDSKGDNGRTKNVDLSGPDGASVRDRRYLDGSSYGYGSGGGSDGRYLGGSGGDYEFCGFHQDGRRSFSPESFRLGMYSVNEE